ncbi:MAG: nuclear transport factor 2 family protein [Acidobacteria bacterium]|nr:nuclear transport factor 2 family protein [Acidobacteriota bacterium]
MKKLTLIALVVACTLTFVIQAKTYQEKEAVREAAMDYIEALYQVDSSRIARSVHPNLTKHGFYREGNTDSYKPGMMTYQQLYDLAGRWNKNGQVKPDAPKEVIVLDVLDQTASVKVVAQWGIDYMHLAKYDGKWKIINVLWQSHPK